MKTRSIICGLVVLAGTVLILDQRPSQATPSSLTVIAEPSETAPTNPPTIAASVDTPYPEPRPLEASPPDPTTNTPRIVTALVGEEYLSFTIDPEYLDAAEELYTEIQDDFIEDINMEDELKDVERRFRYHSASNIISLRLAADPQTAELMGLILSRYPELEAQRLVAAKREAGREQLARIQNNKTAVVAYLALDQMQDEADAEMSAEQQLFYENFERWSDDYFERWDDLSRMQPWYVNRAVVETMKGVLTPTQFEELLIYRDEKIHREIEQDAYYRSLDVAESTGLNEADRSALFEYLQEHPKATDEDIAQLLDPALRELMPRRGCMSCY